MSGPGLAAFTGDVSAKVLRVPNDDSRMAAYAVTFAAGARTHWHAHPHGQLLVVVSGVARVQLEGQRAGEVDAGDTVWIPPGSRHWHGAGPSGSMTHIAVQEAAADGSTVTWNGPVSDVTYNDHEPTTPEDSR
jgi:quercetin dioxygenase-like cupin family protein